MTSTLITNARIVNEGRIEEGDVLIKDGRIEALGAGLAAGAADTVVDAAGKALLPGMIDDQVHFREPGMPEKADIASESRAAVAGGITSFMDMPNTQPNAITRQRIEEKYEIAAQKSLANYAFYFGAANDNLDEIKALDPTAVCGIKLFMPVTRRLSKGLPAVGMGNRFVWCRGLI